MSLGDDGLNLPYEDVPGGPIPMNIDVVLSGGLTISAITLEVEGAVRPGLLFRFARADGYSIDPIVLVVSPEQLRALTPLVKQATTSALQAVGEGRQNGR